MTFTNKRYFIHQTFEIHSSSLKIERRNLFESAEYEIALDRIDNKKTIETLLNSNLLITGVFFFFI